MQDKLTKQTVMELTLSEQLRERQEMEKKLQKLAKTMDYLERAKREEAAPLVEAAYQQRLVEEKALHEHEQQVFLRFCLWRFFFFLEKFHLVSLFFFSW
jgi:translation initiation factor 3 subunit A